MFTKLLLILMAIESGGDPQAIGDNGKAVGVLQIHPIMVAEANRIAGTQFQLKHRLQPRASKVMCINFLKHQIKRYKARHKVEPTEFQLLCSWNSGSIFRPATKSYQKKVRRFLSQIKNGETK